ncbi:MAG TPA: HPr family phosphocarrier protein [bacterium]|mgnify:CR=1 FL=1|jgi:phosphocarrier protein|nr:HPr family phosphocarrier protein [bacterium]MDX9805188.1 HPr family phosphocarrier protein [bacterium]HNW16163.1 HPr family phosphocarrier protein [bacterium]HNZ53691.1 HPr family phosphocarrier protein [bacterium]HOB71705.1 HPr family phosphocarrier protein [bacterium]
MKDIELKITNKLGMHARAASMFVKTAEKYKCRVEMEKDGVRVNAKSIMGILMLAAPVGSVIRLITEGEKEEECLKELADLIVNKFGEGE